MRASVAMLFLLAAAPVLGEAAIPGPAITAISRGHNLVLPAATSLAVQRAVPGFRTWNLADYGEDIAKLYTFTSRQAPWAVVGDFNADGLPDVVMDGHTENHCYRLCVWGEMGGPRVEVLRSSTCPGPSINVLMYVAPGMQGTNFSDDTRFIFADGYMDYLWEKAGSTWYWKDNRWNEFVSSD